jgi:hypothetical protein
MGFIKIHAYKTVSSKQTGTGFPVLPQRAIIGREAEIQLFALFQR